MRWLENLITAVCPDNVGFAVEEPRVYVEVLPHELIDVMRDPVKIASYRAAPDQEPIGYHSIHHAIIEAHKIGARLMVDVKPDNLFFFFGQTVQSLHEALLRFSPAKAAAKATDQERRDFHEAISRGQYKNHPENTAIVLCKVRHIEPFGNMLRHRYENCRPDEGHCVTWSFVHYLKQRFDNL